MAKLIYPLTESVLEKADLKAAIKVINSKKITMGQKTQEIESFFKDKIVKVNSLMVNSGSSANLLALSSLKLKKGSEVITPTLTFSTTVAPIYQLGLIANFVGVLNNKFIADPEQIRKAINKKTSAIMIPNLLGNIADWKAIYYIARKKKIPVIEDSADTIGYKYKKGNTGKFLQ